MELDRLIDYIDGNLENQYPKNIIVSEFTFNNLICNNVDFVFMGIAESKENKGKAIYLSKDCLPGVKVSMDSLLSGSINMDIGNGNIGKAAANSLDSAVFAITKKHLQEYTREYDGRVHTEKVFFPLECEVFGRIDFSLDRATFNKYPQWDGFKKSPDLIKKDIDYLDNKYENWFWWEANRSIYRGLFCLIYGGNTGNDYLYDDSGGCSIAFCL